MRAVPLVDGKKVCRDCSQAFPPTTDYFSMTRGRLNSYCKPCAAKRAKAHCQQNHERGLAMRAAYREAHREEAREYARILRRDPCCYCGARVERIEIDHITPIRAGGLGNWENLTPACKPCNQAKSGKTLLGFLLERSAS